MKMRRGRNLLCDLTIFLFAEAAETKPQRVSATLANGGELRRWQTTRKQVSDTRERGVRRPGAGVSDGTWRRSGTRRLGLD
ncbi:hypothetical protein GOBAR_DD01103 [Gossypium barbadense]|nr:hypothetical protein GOBAR_DD01103 [Gossypium barbadense]